MLNNHTGVSNPVICEFAASTACNCNCRCLQELGVAKVGSRLNKRCLHLLEGGKCYLFFSTEKCSSRTSHQLYWTEIAGSSFKPTNGWQIWEDCELSASVNLLRHTNRLFFFARNQWITDLCKLLLQFNSEWSKIHCTWRVWYLLESPFSCVHMDRQCPKSRMTTIVL